MSYATMIWLDVEATGLEATRDVVLEIAAIATTDDLSEIDRFQAVTDGVAHLDDRAIAAIDPFVMEMHRTSGLWDASLSSPHRQDTIDDQLAEFIRRSCTRDLSASQVDGLGSTAFGARGVRAPRLAGSSIYFDLGFLKHGFPLAAALLHYRLVDVTTVHEMAKRHWPEIHCRREHVAHRALADVESSLDCMRQYVRAIGGWRSTAQAVVGAA